LKYTTTTSISMFLKSTCSYSYWSFKTN